MNKLIKKLRKYAEKYRKPPYGMEVDGTPELLEQAENNKKLIEESKQKMKSDAEEAEKLACFYKKLSKRI